METIRPLLNKAGKLRTRTVFAHCQIKGLDFSYSVISKTFKEVMDIMVVDKKANFYTRGTWIIFDDDTMLSAAPPIAYANRVKVDYKVIEKHINQRKEDLYGFLHVKEADRCQRVYDELKAKGNHTPEYILECCTNNGVSTNRFTTWLLERRSAKSALLNTNKTQNENGSIVPQTS
jgi:hypothetical protein